MYYSSLCGFNDIVEHLVIKHPEHVNAIGGRYQLPLLAALLGKHTEVANTLLNSGADVHFRDNWGKTPLHTLFEGDYDAVELARLLLEHGADVNRRDRDNNTPLHLVMASWMYKCVAILLEHGAEVNAENKESKTPLHLLFENSYSDEDDLFDIAQLLIQRGADVNIREMDQWAPLHWAAFDGRLSIARLLLDHGARVSAENDQSEVPLLLVSQGNYKSQEHGAGLAQLLLEHGADVNARAKNEWTPLHWAAFKGRLEITQLLLDHGANVNAENDYRETPLHLASAGQYDSQEHGAAITSLLLERGADTNARDKDNANPLHWAAYKGRLEATGSLLRHGTDMNAENDNGETPLHLVARGKYESQEHGASIVRLFLEQGVDVNVRTKHEWTPLHSAAFNGKLRVVGALLYQGANASAENDRGETPLHLVSRGNYISEEDGVGIAELLLERGSDTNARDNNNATPLQLAHYRGRSDIARVLLDHDAKAHPKRDQDLALWHLGPDGENSSLEEGSGAKCIVI